jgi:glutamyl-tRNA synthetase
MSAPRVRFAPSPTGELHVGSARTSLFNWLFARQQGGTFVLRIEDTDAERSRPEWIDGIVAALSWLGMSADEGPILQSSRFEQHRVAVEALWEAGALYACDCTREEVEVRTRGNAIPGYDGHCSSRGLERGEGRALRFRTPTEGTTVVHDLVRGDVSFPHQSMEDFVCVKSSGQPLFVLANVVDDRDMAISHVIRGEDLLPTTPKGILVWQALDRAAAGGALELPVFAHLPMLVNAERKKLSKRRDQLAVESYRDEGYLPDAFRNYLALLGWSPPGQQEKIDLDTLIAEFRLEDVHHAPAFFDVKKLLHLNKEYIKELPVEAFVAVTKPWVSPAAGDNGSVTPVPPPWPADRFDPAVFSTMAPLVQERVALLQEVPAMVDFLFLADPEIEEASWQGVAGDPRAAEILEAATTAYDQCEWKAPVIYEMTAAVADSLGLKLNKAQNPIRVAITGRKVGPPLFEPMEILGRDETLRRLRTALERLGS